ncbi:rho GTPase-activating protein 32-like isoform X3 [Gallus gallus]|uniref:rho GTPase-activating protein 32-like isoform X3 n=1 Tax=Gallus gallus TaxID=9031 RepID=UPI001AE2CDEB|nr:rho GTPase-activating protein 32-like isoform X3 [Gallus gallus]
MTTRRQRNRQRMRTDTALLRSRCHACAFASGTASLRSAAQLARTAGGERSARRDLLGRWGGGAVVMAAVSGAVGSEIRSKMRRNNGIGAERGASPARCCVLLPGHECDSEQSPDPTQDSYVCGVHSVSSLCKMYFRELPNPLLSDRLYEQLSDTVLYHGASPCGCLLLPQSCSHWRRHRHRRGHSNSPVVSDSREIEAEEGPAALQGKFHPVSGFPSERKSPANEMKKSAAGSWHSCFSLGKSPSVAKQIAAQTQEPSEAKVVAVAGESNRFRPRRPRPSSGALCTSFSAELSGSTNRCSSDDNNNGDKEQQWG